MKISIASLSIKEIKEVSGGEGLLFIGGVLAAIGAYIYTTYNFHRMNSIINKKIK